MKHALVFCFFSAFIIGLANCDCITDCTSTYTSAILNATNENQCTVVLSYLSCLSSCSAEIASYIQEMLNLYGASCDLSSYSGSTSPSLSFLTVLVGPLFAAYRTFGL